MEWTTSYLADKHIDNPRLNVEWMLSDTLGCKRLDLYMDQDRPLSANELVLFKSRLLRRANHEPLQYIIGRTEFMGLTLEVNPSVLIPRPDTELLVEKALECAAGMSEPLRILDIGTGSGAVAISLAAFLRRRGIPARIAGLDIRPEAVDLAKRNATRLLGEGSVHFLVADVLSADDMFGGPFDVIVSNPPYISDTEFDVLPAEVREYEPHDALRAADNGLIFYKHISNLCKRLFDPAGHVRACLFEVGYNQADEVRRIMVGEGFQSVTVYHDYGGRDRVVKGIFQS